MMAFNRSIVDRRKPSPVGRRWKYRRSNLEQTLACAISRLLPPIALALVAVVGLRASVHGAEREVLAWPPPYDYSGTPATISFKPIAKAERQWRICASYPHLKDAYWISVNYGMVAQATAAGVRLTVVDAGGYPNVKRQREQIETCSHNADALIVGAVSYDGLSEVVRAIAARIPVIAAVNDMEDAGLAAKVGISWTEMGRIVGAYLASRHPTGGAAAKVAWFPGPSAAGWVKFIDAGFRAGLAGSAATISIVKWGDTGFDIQSRLVEETLESGPPVDYIVGSAVTADAAVSVLRERRPDTSIKIFADYFTHGTYRAIKRGRLIAAPTDSPVLQGRLAIDQAIRALEQKLEHRHVGPSILLVYKSNVDRLDLDDSLAPGWFEPRFEVP
ncbi:TMAO reductase system periplasmic protein TorT [Methylobacterium nodulans]|uniref:TMAO reductase system periplasmic protein TorT n=1 Tax=Methylobacterium nodulans TaxID=114616 RepID=UPI001FCABAA5|nr:TMAO reductase system periplasmic protein TorT [Methylobacterium nodulans]